MRGREGVGKGGRGGRLPQCRGGEREGGGREGGKGREAASV